MDHGFTLAQVPPPPLMHQPPPQIFGSYGPDGLPVLGAMRDLDTQSLFVDGSGGFSLAALMEDSQEAKRRRIARACDMCRKKKIKCDGKLPACTHCINYKTECIFTQVEKKRAPPKGAKYIEALENRHRRLEHLLRLSGILNDDDEMDLGELERRLLQKSHPGRPDAASPSSPGSVAPSALLETNEMTPRSALASPEPTKNGDKSEHHVDGDKSENKGVEELSDMMCSLVTNNCGETRYIGSSSGFSIFSPKGIAWVNEKTGDSSFQEMITSGSVDEHKWMYWKTDVFSDLFQRRIFKPLPCKAEAISLLKDYFENFNCMVPLFHQPTFMHLVDKQYSPHPYEGSGWWASLNVALAIAHRLRVMSNLVPAEEDEKAWGYLKNALAVTAELTMRNTDLLSVQALLGMAMFMQGTPNPQPSFFLVAAAIRLSHSIGLHKRGSGFNLNPVEIEQRKRVFWIGYMLDKDICLRSGRPPAQDDNDMNVELPSADPEDNIGNIPLADGKGKVNLFRLMSEFATIESKVYNQLYSVKAAKQSDGELLNTIGELDRLLEEWKDNIPIDFRPEHEIKAAHTPLVLHVVVLHFAYYNCLTTIHRMSIHHGYWTSRLSEYAIKGLNTRPLNPRVFASAALCVAAARASIDLIKYVPQGDFACVWLILYFPVSALVTLFGHILQNPHDPRARSDVRLMGVVVRFLAVLMTEAENGGVKRMLGVCSEFERIASVVLDKAEREHSSRRKRKTNDHAGMEPIHDPTMPLTPTQRPTPRGPDSAVTSVFPPGGPATNGPGRPQASPAKSLSPSFGGSPPNSSPWPPPPPPGGQGMVNGHRKPSLVTNPEYLPAGLAYPHAAATGDLGSPLSAASSFQQPFVPQDLWQMPMTFEWDWADMTGGQYPSFENGLVADPMLYGRESAVQFPPPSQQQQQQQQQGQQGQLPPQHQHHQLQQAPG